MRRALLTLAIALLVVTGCAEKKHLEALERAWEAQPPATASMQERLGALQAFLVQYPANHDYGNPHADEAAAKITELQLALKDERDAAAAAAKALAGRTQVRRIVSRHLFSQLAEVDHAFEASFDLQIEHPTPAREVRASHEGARVITRHRLGAPAPYTRPAAELVEEATRAAGRAIVDEKTGAVDVETLKTVLDLAWLEPGDELLGVTAREVYPYFAPWVREQVLTLRAIKEAGMSTLKNERAAYLARSGQQDDPEPQLLAFYRFLTDNSGPLGLVWPALDHEGASPDVGFWMRRETDGSYETLEGFLHRVVKAYDPALHKTLESDRPVALLAPVTGQDTPVAERAWTPAPLSGDRLLSETPSSVQTVSRRAAAWRPDGQMLALHNGIDRIRLIDAKTGEARELSLPRGKNRNRPARMSFSASGDLLVTSFDGERGGATSDRVDTEIAFYDVASGVVADRYPWPGHEDIWQLAVSPDGTGVSAADFVGAAYFPRGDDAGPSSVVRLPGAWAVDIDPTGRFVATGGEVVTICALPGGEKIASYNGLRGVSSLSFSPDGHRLVIATRSGDRAHLVHFDEKNKALVRDAVLGERITQAAWLDDGSVLLHSGPRRTASVWTLDDRSHDVSVVGDDLLAVDRARRRVVFDTRTDDVVLYSLAP